MRVSAGHLAAKGILSRWTPHVNALWERSTGFDFNLSTFAGVEYQITSRVAFDASGQRIGWSAPADRQLLLGMTVNLGKAH